MSGFDLIQVFTPREHDSLGSHPWLHRQEANTERHLPAPLSRDPGTSHRAPPQTAWEPRARRLFPRRLLCLRDWTPQACPSGSARAQRASWGLGEGGDRPDQEATFPPPPVGGPIGREGRALQVTHVQTVLGRRQCRLLTAAADGYLAEEPSVSNSGDKC